MNYRQCTLQRENTKQVLWLKEKIAKKGFTVKLKNDDGTWDEGWKVIDVNGKLEEKYLLERSQDYKRTRNASDI